MSGRCASPGLKLVTVGSPSTRRTVRSEIPGSRATSACAWPALRGTWISCRFIMSSILLAPLPGARMRAAEVAGLLTGGDYLRLPASWVGDPRSTAKRGYGCPLRTELERDGTETVEALRGRLRGALLLDCWSAARSGPRMSSTVLELWCVAWPDTQCAYATPRGVRRTQDAPTQGGLALRRRLLAGRISRSSETGGRSRATCRWSSAWRSWRGAAPEPDARSRAHGGRQFGSTPRLRLGSAPPSSTRRAI